MKKLLLLISTVALVSSCAMNEEPEFAPASETYEFIGYNGVQTRTQFGEPTGTEIPFLWSEGDYIWIGSNQSEPIAENCEEAKFSFTGSLSIVGDYYPVFYNLTGEHKNAKVLAEQSAANNLGENGDFGFAKADEYRVFMLEHRTSYLWFNTTTPDAEMPKLTSITVTAADDIALAGKSVFDYENEVWSTVTEGTNEVVLSFGEGVELQSANEDIFATMVTLPATIANTDLTIKYTFDDGSTYTEVKTPTVNLEIGQTLRISTDIEKADLVKEPSYELRVLTFEDEDVKFDPIEDFAFAYPDFQGGYWYGDYFTLTKWSDYIPRDGQYGNGHRTYEWYDANNTELEFVWPSEESFWGIAGHAGISDYVGTMDDVNSFPDDNMLFMIDLQAYNVKGGANGSKNFCSQYGYLDPDEYATIYSPEGVLPGIQFHDGEARVIDHMYVTNTTYAYGVIIHGECDFGGSFELTDASTFKIVAYGYDSFDDTEPTITDFYLLNTGQRFVTDWTKWDLSVLGKVVRVEFNLIACDNGYGKYGLVIPAYFAYDDVAVRFEK